MSDIGSNEQPAVYVVHLVRLWRSSPASPWRIGSNPSPPARLSISKRWRRSTATCMHPHVKLMTPRGIRPHGRVIRQTVEFYTCKTVHTQGDPYEIVHRFATDTARVLRPSPSGHGGVLCAAGNRTRDSPGAGERLPCPPSPPPRSLGARRRLSPIRRRRPPSPPTRPSTASCPSTTCRTSRTSCAISCAAARHDSQDNAGQDHLGPHGL